MILTEAFEWNAVNALDSSSIKYNKGDVSQNSFQSLSFKTAKILVLLDSAQTSRAERAIASGNSFFLSFLIANGAILLKYKSITLLKLDSSAHFISLAPAFF